MALVPWDRERGGVEGTRIMALVPWDRREERMEESISPAQQGWCRQVGLGQEGLCHPTTPLGWDGRGHKLPSLS